MTGAVEGRVSRAHTAKKNKTIKQRKPQGVRSYSTACTATTTASELRIDEAIKPLKNTDKQNTGPQNKHPCCRGSGICAERSPALYNTKKMGR